MRKLRFVLAFSPVFLCACALGETPDGTQRLAIGAVVSAATFQPVVGRGSIASSYWQTDPGCTEEPPPHAVPLPDSLCGYSIRINHVKAPLFGVYGASHQINFQVPYSPDLTTGDPKPFELLRGPEVVETVPTCRPETGNACGPGATAVTTVSPGIFTKSGDGSGPFQGYIATVPNTPGMRVAVVYGTGLGPLGGFMNDGYPNPAQAIPGGNIANMSSASIGGMPTTVTFAGNAPGFVGLNQFNINVPSGLSAGSYPLLFCNNTCTQDTVKIVLP